MTTHLKEEVINFIDLPGRTEFIGKPIKEHGVDEEKPLLRFEVKNGSLDIFVSSDDGEECIGGLHTDHGSARICEDGNLYITGMYAPTFVLYMED